MSRYVVDTHALVWLVDEPSKLERGAFSMLRDAAAANETIFVSAVSAWEIGLLVARERLKVSAPPQRWFAQATSSHLLNVMPVGPDDYLTSALMTWSHRDPVDRLLVAVAQRLDMTLVTRDARILSYADDHRLHVLPC